MILHYKCFRETKTDTERSDNMNEATKLAGRITITDETLKNEIIEYALRKIGTTRIGLLDGMTLVYQDRWYDITVENGNVTIDEV